MHEKSDRMTSDVYDNTYIIVPAKDEERFVKGLVQSIVDVGFKNIVLVNDNSKDRTVQLATEVYRDIVILDHIVNLGAGAATQTGIDYALSQGADVICTIDADHQHNPNDLVPLIECLKEKEVDLVIGSRFMKRNKIPVSRIFFNIVGNIINFFMTGLVITDSQSGLKAMSRRFAESLTITFNGFEFCIEIIKNAQITRSDVYEYPIDVRYSKETMDKGQSIFSGFQMLGKLFNPYRR